MMASDVPTTRIASHRTETPIPLGCHDHTMIIERCNNHSTLSESQEGFNRVRRAA